MSSTNFLDKIPRYPAAGLIGGVCAGIAAYFDWNPRLLRVITVLGLIFGLFFPVFVSYLVLWYLMDPARGHPGQNESAQGSGTQMSADGLRQHFDRLETRLRGMEAVVADGEYELRRELRKL